MTYDDKIWQGGSLWVGDISEGRRERANGEEQGLGGGEEEW